MALLQRSTFAFLSSLAVMAWLGAPPALAADGEAEDLLPPAPAESALGDGGGGAASEGSDASRLSRKLPNFNGLSGFRGMIDARTPEGLTIRGGARLRQSKESLEGQLFELKKDQLDLDAYVGVSLFSVIDVGARLPFVIDRDKKGSYPGMGDNRRERTQGLGDLDVAAKISLDLGGPVVLAPYVIGRFPTGEKNLWKSRSGVEIGGSATAELFAGVVAIHANVGAAWLDGGDTSIRYKFGPSIVPIATRVILIRTFAYLDGVQALHDDPGSDLRVAAGAQALLFQVFTAEIGGSYRFHETTAPQGLRDDKGTWSVEFGAGVAF